MRQEEPQLLHRHNNEGIQKVGDFLNSNLKTEGAF